MKPQKTKIYGLILSMALLILMSCVLNARAAKAAEGQPTSQKGRVLDLGELEVEGEVRRPPVDWIDSSKRIKGQIPALYASQFRKLEEELLKPITKEKAVKVLPKIAAAKKAAAKGVNSHVSR